MTDYRIKELGSCFVVAAEGQDVLRCADENMARQIVKDAEASAGRATRPLWWVERNVAFAAGEERISL